MAFFISGVSNYIGCLTFVNHFHLSPKKSKLYMITNLMPIRAKMRRVGKINSQQEQKQFLFHNIQFLLSNAVRWVIVKVII